MWIGLVKEGSYEDTTFTTNTVFFKRPEAVEWAENITKGLSKFGQYEEFYEYGGDLREHFFRIINKDLGIETPEGLNTSLEWVSNQVEKKKKAFCKQYKIPILTIGVEIQEVDVNFPKGWMVIMPGPDEKI